MPHINTLIPDVYKILQTDGWFSDEIADELGKELVVRLKKQFNRGEKKPELYLSQLGPKCPRALWYSIHHPELAEPLPPQAKFKFTYGDMIEALAITLAKAAGHDVRGEQDSITVDGVRGRRDCIIDGVLVDVKSANSRSFLHIKTGAIGTDDAFGYLDQLDGYMAGSLTDPLVQVKDKAYLWAIDKELGHMTLYEHQFREQSIRFRITKYKDIIERPEAPTCECGTMSEGKSGNIKLDTRASYSPYKHCCWPHLRTFIYAGGKPTFLTKVVRTPDVLEVDKHGKRVYH